jgi:hypothetical protein
MVVVTFKGMLTTTPFAIDDLIIRLQEVIQVHAIPGTNPALAIDLTVEVTPRN